MSVKISERSYIKYKILAMETSINSQMLAMETSMNNKILAMENSINGRLFAMETSINNQIVKTQKSISEFETKFEILRNQMQDIKKPNVENVENNQKENVNIS